MLLNVKIIIVDYKGVARGEQGERPPPPQPGKFAKDGEQPTNQPERPQ